MTYASLYGWVYANVPHYGAGHGGPAVPLVAGWLRNGGTLVDVGCGRQQFNATLRAMVPGRLIGVDVVRCDPVPDGVEFVQAEAWDLSAVPAVDVVASFDFLEHLEPHDVPRTLAAWAAKLNPGGRLVATICSRASFILGPEGVNLHPTVRPPEWWLSEIGQHFDGATFDGVLYQARSRCTLHSSAPARPACDTSTPTLRG